MNQEIQEKDPENKKDERNQHECHLCPKSLICPSDLENHMLDHLLENNF